MGVGKSGDCGLAAVDDLQLIDLGVDRGVPLCVAIDDDRLSLARGKRIDVHDVLTKLLDVLTSHLQFTRWCSGPIAAFLSLFLFEVEDFHRVLRLRKVRIFLFRNGFHFARWSSLLGRIVLLDVLIQVRLRCASLEVPIFALFLHSAAQFGLGAGADLFVVVRVLLLINFKVQFWLMAE